MLANEPRADRQGTAWSARNGRREGSTRMSLSRFGGWLQNVRAAVVDDGRSCEELRTWLLEAGALVMHTPSLEQALHSICAHPEACDVVLIDADAHPAWERLAGVLPPECSALVVSSAADEALLQRVLGHRASFASRGRAQPDFVFGVYTLLCGAAPDLGRLAARGARMWALSPQLTRLLHFNLWGYSDRDIADALSISVKTAQQYQEELRRKTGVKSRQAYLRRLLMLAGQEPLLPMTDHTQTRIEQDRELLRSGRPPARH